MFADEHGSDRARLRLAHRHRTLVRVVKPMRFACARSQPATATTKAPATRNICIRMLCVCSTIITHQLTISRHRATAPTYVAAPTCARMGCCWPSRTPPPRPTPPPNDEGKGKGTGKGNDKSKGAGKSKLRPDAFLTNAELLERRAERQRRRLGYQ